MGGDLNAATSRTGFSISTKPHFEKVDNQFQEIIQRTGGSLFQSEAHTRKDLMGGASLDDMKVQHLTTSSHGTFPMMIRPNAGAEEYSALDRSVCERSCADLVHNR